MIINQLTAEQYELLDVLEDARLRPAKNPNGETITETDPRLRVIEAQLSGLIENFDADAAITIAQMADELVARNTARIKYAQSVMQHAAAGHDASEVLVNLLEELMLANGVKEAKNEQMHLQMIEMDPQHTWAITDPDAIPDEYWHHPDAKSVDRNKVAMRLENEEAEIAGITRKVTQPPPRLRRR